VGSVRSLKKKKMGLTTHQREKLHLLLDRKLVQNREGLKKRKISIWGHARDTYAGGHFCQQAEKGLTPRLPRIVDEDRTAHDPKKKSARMGLGASREGNWRRL